MQVRLAFATAIQKEPDILIVDEVLAVGDMEFQQKCLDVFNEYKKNGVTMLFVSHDLNSVRKFCDKTMLIKNSRVAAFGETNGIINKYIYGSNQSQAATSMEATENTSKIKSVELQGENKSTRDKVDEEAKVGNKKVIISSLEFIDKYGNENANFASGDPMTIHIRYEVREVIEDLGFGIIFYNEAGIYCYGTTTGFKKLELDNSIGKKSLDLIIDRIPMLEGRYYITIAAAMHYTVIYDWQEKAYSFIVHRETQDLGLFEIPSRWESKPKRVDENIR
jgi:lipopolysaccharide transport system ATP-binding protein